MVYDFESIGFKVSVRSEPGAINFQGGPLRFHFSILLVEVV